MKHKMFKKLTAGVLAAALFIQSFSTVAYAAENPFGSFFANLLGAKAENTSAFTTLEIREGTLSGAVVVNLLNPTAGWKLEAGKDYYLYGVATRQQGTDSVQIRAGNADGSFNGLTFFNPPGGTYVPTNITHDYFDKLSSYDAIPNPTYGYPVKELALQDGTATYHIKDTVNTGDGVTFAMGLVLDATAHNGNTILPNALEVAIGSVSGTGFQATASKSTDVNVSPKGELSANFNGLSATAMLDAPGGWIYPRISNVRDLVTLLYDKLEYDLYYPKDAVLTNIGFSATTNTEKNYGTLTSGQPVIEGKLKKSHITIVGGYKPGNVNLQSCAQFTFSSDYFVPGQTCNITLQNIKITPQGGGDVISLADAKNAVIYTILDPKADYTELSALNRPLVYNHTTDTSAPYMVTLGAAEIRNKSTSATSPYGKTYEADFNTTNTAAVISAITVPLGTNSSPVVNWEGIAADGSKKSGTLANPGDYAQRKGNIAGSKFLQIKASDLGIKSFTSVKAEIGQIRANYNSSGSGSNWDITYNGSGAFGYFTTGESGIQVKNTYRLYNTDPAQRNIVGGNLTTTSTATSTAQDRMGFISGDATIKNDAGKAVDSIAAGDTATISGNVYPYSVPEATGKEGLAGSDALAVDPVIYLTLPAGLTYDTLSFTLAEQRFDGSTNNDQALSHFVENVSYLNTTNDGVSIYKITFPAGTTLGYYNGDGSRFTLYYTIKLHTSKSMETKRYELNKLIGVTTKNNVEAMSITSNPATLNTVMTDTYGMNGGKDYAGITKGSATEQPGFGLQQLAEVNVYNAVSVTKINGQAISGAWQTYDPSDPNSIASLGKNSEGQFRLNIQNTSTTASGALELLLPIPKKGVDMGDVFTKGASAFDMAVTIPTTELAAQNFSGKYVTVSGIHDVYNQKISYSDSNAASANAILLTANAIPASANLFFQFPFTVTDGVVGATNIWRNAFQYTTTESVTSYKSGSYVASAVAGSSITGTVFDDKNRNGLREAGEQGVPGVTVVVKDSENKILSAVTDASGSYTFLAVRETPVSMTYTIPESQKLRFNIPRNMAENGSKVTPDTDGLSATHSFTATGKTETVNAAVSGYATLSYDKNNAAATGDLPTTDECPPGSTVTVSVKPDNLLYKGYIFKEWNTAPDGKGTGYQPGQTLTVTDSVTLYAIWEIGSYTLRFDYRGATGGNTTTEKHLTHNQSYDTGGALPAPTRPGYTFKGWAVNAVTTTVIAESALFTLGEDSILYAVWTAKSGYTVKYDTGGGTSIADMSVTWVQGVLPTDAPTRTGYTFNGWYHQGKKVTIAATYGILAGTDTPSITLDAGWTAKTGYTVHYNSTGGTAVPDKTDVAWSDSGLLPQNNPTKTNFAFGGWKLTGSETLVTSATTYSELAVSDNTTAITLDAVWNMLANNTVSYETGGGTIYTDKTNVLPTDKGLIPTVDPVRAGYEFIGWMSGANTVTAETIYSSLTTNTTLTLTANWRAKSYTISYSEGGFASITKGWNDSGLIGGKIPTKDGSTFDGWYYGTTKVTDTTKVSGLIPQDNITTVTLTAKWNEGSYTIAYASNGGSSFPPKTGVKYSASNLLPDSAPVRLGYTFTGWQCGDIPVTVDTTCGTLANKAVGGVITLSANWEAKTGYTVRYNSTGGTAVPDKTGVTWTQTALTPAVNPTRNGYEFKAWVSRRTTVTSTTAYGTIATDDASGSSVTLVAQWNEDASYTVKFDTGAGKPVEDKTNLTLDSSNLLPLHDIAPAGFQLTGWTFKGMTVTQSTTYGELAAIAGGAQVVLTAVYAPTTAPGGATDVQGKVVETVESAVYKIDISWGPMTFDYFTNKVWNPDSHSYELGTGTKGWTKESFESGNNKITVANHSNGDVKLSYFTKLDAVLTGATMTVRSTNSLASPEANNLPLAKVPSEAATAPTVDTFVWLTGEPTDLEGLNNKSYTKAGVITITAQPDTAGGLTPKNLTP